MYLWGELRAGVLDSEDRALLGERWSLWSALSTQIVDDRVVHEVDLELQQERV